MGRKVFLSVLGTGFYKECRYGRDGFTSKSTRFIQRATLEWLGAGEWGEEDRVFIATTKGARKWNWNESTSMRSPKPGDPEVPYPPLETTLKEMKLKAKVEAVDIPDGGNEEEMWRIFSILFGLIEEGDELYFDLTHSFRYLPMLVLVLGNYSKFLKGVSVRSITYGNYEARDKDCIAPIIDLLPLTALQDWTFAIADYLKNGNTGELERLYPQDEKQDSQNETDPLRSSVNALIDVVRERKTCRGMDVYNSSSVNKLLHSLDSVKADSSVLPALMPMLERVKASLTSFAPQESLSNMFAAAEWCKINQQYQAAITFLEEGVISFFCLRHEIRLNNEYRRDLVNSAITFKKNPDKYNPQRYTERDNDTIKELLDDELLCQQDFLENYKKVTDLRNDYNHCGMRNKSMKPNEMNGKIDECIQELKDCLHL